MPAFVTEPRQEAIMAAYEASRTAARVKAELARERVARNQEEAGLQR